MCEVYQFRNQGVAAIINLRESFVLALVNTNFFVQPRLHVSDVSDVQNAQAVVSVPPRHVNLIISVQFCIVVSDRIRPYLGVKLAVYLKGLSMNFLPIGQNLPNTSKVLGFSKHIVT